ncbi:MAG: hypothetical protein Q4E13_09985 [Clostridia bacterium]|nr:hypothetical protein [Clostridia bacterium]
MDMFELIVGLIVVIAGICVSANKNSRKRRPGQQSAARTLSKEPPKPAMQAKKPNLQQGKPQKQAAPAKLEMAPEAMVPEEMQPEKMIPELLMQMELGEGESRGDANGCLGGSLIHDESTHQGVEFHSAGAHGRRRSRPEATQARPAAVTRPSAAQLRNAVIWSEILDKPVSMRE